MHPQKRGRPATGKGAPIQVRLQPDLLAWVDEERDKLDPAPTRPEMIRRLLERLRG
ncbi:ribbon-helix-helix protein, CopG family [Cereibacter sphaeroides]|nr:ribbon-helix-helix protein, CopG family [Cereibacter sphaeroides]